MAEPVDKQCAPQSMPSVASDSPCAEVVIHETPGIKRAARSREIVYHSITAMVGAGVLALPYSMAQLGWAGGTVFLVFSILVSWYTYKLLAYMHEVPDLDAPKRLRRLDRYDELAQYLLGERRGKNVLLPFQLAVLLGVPITYTVVGGSSLREFVELVAPSVVLPSQTFYLIFGGLQLCLSMLPNFHDLSFVSLLGAVMSFSYCTIAVAMSGSTRPGPEVNYDPAAVVAKSTVDRVMGVFNALTTVFYAYGGHNIALEIQATIPVGADSNQSSVPTMMRGVHWTFVATGLCYFGVSIVGFWAFGTDVSENVLTTFSAGPYSWIVAMANMFVVVHVAAAYQLFANPVFTMIEADAAKRRGGSPMPIPMRAAVRIACVLGFTAVAVVVPFFGALMGFIGAVAITPTTFLLPPLFWLMLKRPDRWSSSWVINWSLVWVTGLIGLMGVTGSMYIIVTSWKTFRIAA